MDSERQRIEEDLRGAIAGDVRCDDLFTQLFASDASIYQLTPMGVVRPRNLNDVVTVVQYAAEHGLSIHARGAGSGLAGESLGRGLVVDFSRYFRRIIETNENQVRVQAGVVLARLNRHLAQTGRVFGPDPAMSEITTLGGAVAIDAAGSHWPRYGSVRRHVRSLRGVLADGQPVELGQHSVSSAQKTTRQNGSSTRLQSLVTATAQLLERHAGAIGHGRPKSLVNRSGYGLHDLVDGDQLDLAKLIVGSEGTLALVTDVTLSTEPLPGHTGCMLLLFSSMDNAAQAALEIARLEPSACDLMDRRHLTLARETDPRYEFLIPGQAEAVLLVEYYAETAADLRDRLDQTIELLQYKTKLAAGAIEAADEADAQLFWQLARRFVPTLHRLKGSTRPVPCIEDIAVPPEALGVFLRHMHLALKRQQVTASLFGHAAHGQLHIRPFLDLANPDDVHKMESLAGELYEKVWLLGGTISGEHGDGLSRTPFLARQYGPLVNVFREVKQLFDPRGTLNPGKVVPTTHSRMTHDLRQVSYAKPPAADLDEQESADLELQSPQAVPLQLNWEPEEITLVARACNGCGGCRTLSEEDRMCPIFRFAPREEASPRAKANMVRALLTGTLSQEEFFQETTKQAADLCVHCHMCRIECPSNVDIPKLMLEAKSLHVQTNGLSVHDWLLTRIDAMSNLAGKFPVAANWLLKQRQARWVMEHLLGIAQGRKLPRFARRKFIRWATLRRLHRHSATAGEKVLYFVDTYANQFDPELAKSLVAVLRHNGISTYVPTDQRHSAMAMIVQGALDPARRVAEHNVALLADAVRRGYTIVATEPSAVLALTHEYPNILDDDDDALLVAKHTHESCHYLWQLHQRGQLRLDFQPLQVSVGYHVPCHVKALEVGTPAANLMQLIPELRLNRVEKGCSGMAGTFGLKRENYRSSLRAGFDLIHAIRDGNFQVGVTECSACKMQMEQGTSKPTIHPMKLIAMAYGLMPDIRKRLSDVSRPLVVT